MDLEKWIYAVLMQLVKEKPLWMQHLKKLGVVGGLFVLQILKSLQTATVASGVLKSSSHKNFLELSQMLDAIYALLLNEVGEAKPQNDATKNEIMRQITDDILKSIFEEMTLLERSQDPLKPYKIEALTSIAQALKGRFKKAPHQPKKAKAASKNKRR